ncbi:hypothetical protein JMA_30530 [Jeotgalibacillus malaysiensis]|uniref:Uncharacterized protein n=1 Tax=Jeotgalibacillus malaysiensis TaxID=1508404 RepID=A0A0B5AQ71_9BACL|nr:hypothetical protein JMA_30530 [Jeotgalibacillus malaysiensis]
MGRDLVKKLLILSASILLIAGLTLYLYSRMVGAVPFLLLSAVFYWLAWRETKKGRIKNS